MKISKQIRMYRGIRIYLKRKTWNQTTTRTICCMVNGVPESASYTINDKDSRIRALKTLYAHIDKILSYE